MAFNLDKFLNAFETKDADKLIKFLTDDAILQDGNNEPLVGREAIGKAVGDFFELIGGVKFNVIRRWIHPDSIIVQGEVTFTRLDDSEITLPFADIYYLKEDRIQKLYSYIDINPLFERDSA
ncbi:MAG: nuclear transport factor 2 family protein [Deltaproteobacteria bacterium]